MKRLNSNRRRLVLLGVFFGALFAIRWLTPGPSSEPIDVGITKPEIAAALHTAIEKGNFPETIPLTSAHSNPEHPLFVRYTLDPEIQTHMAKTLTQYRPDFGAFVAIEADTGRVLSLVSYQHGEEKRGNLALKASFPAASVFKIVTAAAAIDQNKIKGDTVIAYNGANHTLYRRNILKDEENRWTRKITVKEAFAKSVNTVFGKLGMFFVDPATLKIYAQKFRFNQQMMTDLPLESGRFVIPQGSDWARAEVASGFNRYVTISPVQGALMAAAIANQGELNEPFLVDALFDQDRKLVYEGKPGAAILTMTPQAANEVASLMEETVRIGTSRKAFHSLIHRTGFRDLKIGGKTGSLTGLDPRGKYDWFVGYVIAPGEKRDRKIAVAALTINEELWRVKSSMLARQFIEYYFHPKRQLAREKPSED